MDTRIEKAIETTDQADIEDVLGTHHGSDLYITFDGIETGVIEVDTDRELSQAELDKLIISYDEWAVINDEPKIGVNRN